MHVLNAYASQFYTNSKGISSPINGLDFLKFVEGRALEMGRAAGIEIGEGFVSDTPLLIGDLVCLL